MSKQIKWHKKARSNTAHISIVSEVMQFSTVCHYKYMKGYKYCRIAYESGTIYIQPTNEEDDLTTHKIRLMNNDRMSRITVRSFIKDYNLQQPILRIPINILDENDDVLYACLSEDSVEYRRAGED